jgi:hypothetical protein
VIIVTGAAVIDENFCSVCNFCIIGENTSGISTGTQNFCRIKTGGGDMRPF